MTIIDKLMVEGDIKAFRDFAVQHYKAAAKVMANQKVSSGKLSDNEKFNEWTNNDISELEVIDNNTLACSFGIYTVEKPEFFIGKLKNLAGAKKIDLDIKNPDIQKYFKAYDLSSIAFGYKKLSDGTACLLAIAVQKKYNDCIFIEYIHIDGSLGAAKELVARESTIFDECTFI